METPMHNVSAEAMGQDGANSTPVSKDSSSALDHNAKSLPASPTKFDEATEPGSTVTPDQPKPEISSDRDFTDVEISGFPDFRERFAVMEAKIDMIDRLFGSRKSGDRDLEDMDMESYASDESMAPVRSEFQREIMGDLVMVRDFYQSRKSIFKQTLQKRREQKRATKAAELQGSNNFESEASKKTSTEVFLKGESAKAVQVNWDSFLKKREDLEKSTLTPIEAVSDEPEPHIISQLCSGPENSYSIEPSGYRLAEKIRGLNDIDAFGEHPLPERVKVLSDPLMAIFSGITIDQTWETASDRSIVFLRPFKEFIYHERELRQCLEEMENRFKDYSGAESNPLVPKEHILDNGSSPVEKTKPIDSTVREATGQGEGLKDSLPDLNDGQSNENREGAEVKVADVRNSITALLHLRCLVAFIDDLIHPKLQYISSDRCTKILFNDLWHLLKPGDEVIDQSEKQAFRIIRLQFPQHKVEEPWLRWYGRKRSKNADDERRRFMFPDDEEDQDDETPLTIYCTYIDFDGKKFGPVSAKFTVPPFGGYRDIKHLPVYPFRFAKDSQLRQNLIKRGKMLLEVSRFKSMYYTGNALDTGEEIDSQVVVDFNEALVDETRKKCWCPKIEPALTTPESQGKAMCEANCCFRQAVNNSSYVDAKLTQDFIKSLIPAESFQPLSMILSSKPLEEIMSSGNSPSDQELVVMTFRVFAFVLRNRKWAKLDLTFLRDENVDARQSTLSAFEQLVLPPGHREMVRAQVTQHFRYKHAKYAGDEQTDLIKGKGKGLILLLHGAPGVGKTTTAEGVAEMFQKPLFQITCGDLGTTAREVEAELERNFALASRWGCILLLDEADVFLAAREKKDFERNGLVAVFLRVLEYYTGILFLTTNRLGDFDEAFASRIHMSLHYPELDEAKTRRIFEHNIQRIEQRFKNQGRQISYDDSSILNFASEHFNNNKFNRWNGRQIRNACQTALALAEFESHEGTTRIDMDPSKVVALRLEHFKTVQKAYLDFGHYLGDIRGTLGDRRAIDQGLRARTDTPWQTTSNRPTRSFDGYRPGGNAHWSMSSNTQPFAQHDPFQPTMNQSYVANSNPNLGPAQGNFPQQSQPRGTGGMWQDSQQSQMNPRFFQGNQPQQATQMGFQPGQSWVDPGSGLGFGPETQQVQGQPQHGYGDIQGNFSSRSPGTPMVSGSRQHTPSAYGMGSTNDHTEGSRT